MKGTIKKVIENRGFGFIDTDEAEDDIFFHHTNLNEVSISELRVGQEVEFDIEETEKGPNAVNIQLVVE